MTRETTPEMLAMARKCAAKYWQNGNPSDERTARSILSGDWDDRAYTQAALAAIKETTDRAARMADSGKHNIAHLATPERIATALRNGEHYHDPHAD